jgi:carbamoyltransferase
MMALAAFGDPQRYGAHVRELVRLGEEGEVRIDHPWGSADGSTPLLLDGRAWTADNVAERPEHTRADLAAAVQEVFAESVVHIARHLQRLTRASALVFSGGCALNSHLNGQLAADSGFDTLFVAPAPHDAGTAVGAALYGWHYQLEQERLPVPTDAAWGPNPGALPTTTVPPGYHALSHLGLGLPATVAALLAEHRIVGWVQGQLEFGPRALGHRSILAHPGHAATRDRLNAIKKRAAYRPFAPAVLAEHATEWFMSAGDPFMNRVATVRRCRADRVAAVTHHDGTARVQSVAADHQGLRDLLEQFRDLTGLPLLLNTSFNRKGTPILRTAEQAVAATVELRLDALAVGDTLLLADHVPDPRAASLRTR